ncbi:ubiquitin-conjugating enzyme/RWD-like protein [Myxozyma melibiosi]|uniref:Ubiquitin-conjugating enzyme E2 Z n=1 Tax=Myxozyma melibiosi TaxID=54550 RepID=A0ABR1F5V0_9ASCO
MSSATTTLRIAKELANIQKSPDQGIYVYFDEKNLMRAQALILGPLDTPYEYGLFEFKMSFPEGYPSKPPCVSALTTNDGWTRFNPNIYANGKVCLSILGTWRGEAGEQWSSAQGIESVLMSIQSLMCSNPFENEPGFGPGSERESLHRDKAQQYIQKIQHETLRISVIKRLEESLHISSVTGKVKKTPENEQPEDVPADVPFKDLCKRLFRYYYPSYMRTIAREKQSIKDNTFFETMPFEGPDNEMKGSFDYADLERRMHAITAALDKETEHWATEGAEAVRNHDAAASMLSGMYSQIAGYLVRTYDGTVTLELVDDNPFVWRIIYFGRPTTSLDGALFRIKLAFSVRFPEEQPRAVYETPIYHLNITPSGIPYYRPSKPEDPQSHIEALIASLENDKLSPDPRTWMNLDAAELYFGSDAQKKEYRRTFRRAVMRSAEY